VQPPHRAVVKVEVASTGQNDCYPNPEGETQKGNGEVWHGTGDRVGATDGSDRKGLW